MRGARRSFLLQNYQEGDIDGVVKVFMDLWTISGSVVDLHWFQCGSGSRSRVLMTKNRKKFTTEKKLYFWIKITIYLSLGLHKGRSSYRRSLHPSKENI
jgi:hypothetical protein